MASPNSLKAPRLIQQMWWVADPIGYMETAVRDNPDIFEAKVIGSAGALIFVNDPQAIQEILTSDRKQYAAPGELNMILSPLLGDSSVIMLEGDRHRQRRQLLMPPFHGERMRAYGHLIQELATEVFSQFPVGQPFSARQAMQDISLQVILETVFGLREGERLQQLKQLIVSMAEMFRSPLSSSPLFFPILQQDWGTWSPWGKFVSDRAKIDQLLYAEIAERRTKAGGDRIDILSLLMSARDENGQAMTDQELRDELMTLLFAGHETTATAMSWAIYWTHHLPHVREKLLQELDALGDHPDPTSIFRLPYLTAVCNETLRIHPVGMLTFPRVARKPVKLLGQTLEPGAIVVGCMYLVHQREDLYPEPKQFRPERFLERQFSPYEFIPFGGGSRRCIGEALALFEMKLVLATLLSRYSFALTDRQPEVPRRRGVTLSPKNGVKIKITGQRTRQETPMVVGAK
jgi:unspecific monooxygenase